MKKYLKVLISMVLLLVGFTAFHSNAEAAKNPISPKQSRVTYTLKDANGVAYKVYFAGVREKKAIASYNRGDWAHVWAGANEGDLLYRGNYTLYTQKVGTSHIKKSSHYFRDYTLNATKKSVHMYPSKYKGQPDILAVAETDSEYWENADWYYIKNGVLTHITGAAYTLRAQVLRKNEFLISWYSVEDNKWFFSGAVFDPTKNVLQTADTVYNKPNVVIRDWKKHWQ
ncbi:hypothetical protein ACH0BF_00400 [Pseudobacillus sp. 179-B 2D1 NHS]|uniref:hypothetical protein n=1 Tax=Pseudobacillus sp. 179-B 2D1 NHS TaxID=3374292 RepID=UPI003879716F